MLAHKLAHKLASESQLEEKGLETSQEGNVLESQLEEKGLETSQEGNVLPEEERQHRIEELAYLMAEKRNFLPGHELEDWLTAEREIDEKFFRGEL